MGYRTQDLQLSNQDCRLQSYWKNTRMSAKERSGCQMITKQ